jgi:thiol-disulfide isomerase/thioredoxin
MYLPLLKALNSQLFAASGLKFQAAKIRQEGLLAKDSANFVFPRNNPYRSRNVVIAAVKLYCRFFDAMKKFLTAILLLCMTLSGFSQTDSVVAPYKKFPFFPPVKLLLPDSASFYTRDDLPKKKPVMLMLFNPRCEHCRHETEELVKNIDKFKDIQILMITSMPFDSMLTFREKYKLASFDNIVVAQDPNYFLITYYMLHNLPFLAFYDKKKQLISVFEGSLPIASVLEIFKEKAE